MKYNWKWKIFGRSWNRTSGLLVTPPTELQQTVYLPFKRFSYLAADFGPLLVDILFLPGHYLKPKVRNLKFSLASKFWKPGLLSSLPSLSSSFFKFLGRNLWTETKCDQVEFRCQTAAVDKTGISLIDSSSRSLWPTWGGNGGSNSRKGEPRFLEENWGFKNDFFFRFGSTGLCRTKMASNEIFLVLFDSMQQLKLLRSSLGAPLA